MEKRITRLTTAQFAKLHGVNKRTLHYYDTVGLFSPNTKGDNHYRYYDAEQSIDFEFIKMLKELNMSIGEIRRYQSNPNGDDFIRIAEEKMQDIEQQLQKLQKIKKILSAKKKQIELCNGLSTQEIRLVECEEEIYLTTPFAFEEDDSSQAFSRGAEVWGIEQCRMGIGSYISMEKIRQNNFSEYDGLFTPALKAEEMKKSVIKPKGSYLCGYQRGLWGELPCLYKKMLAYAEEHSLKLTGFAYEMGLNDFAITREEDYITQIMILIDR